MEEVVDLGVDGGSPEGVSLRANERLLAVVSLEANRGFLGAGGQEAGGEMLEVVDLRVDGGSPGGVGLEADGGVPGASDVKLCLH